ncbi:VOC family protein [Janibacter sp. GXQ6167]|uniref:VOC family protein n=1 Tax=Janibacter sp. GXQ6167 TaxID=3240791 RepID=UPI00352421AA
MSERTDHNIWTAIFVDDPQALRAWLVDLGFDEGVLVPGDEPGIVHHSEMLWPEGGRVMVASRRTDGHDEGVGRAGVYVVTDQPDEVHARARAAGATITRPLRDEQGYDSRGFSCLDPEGNHWSFGTYAG